MTSNEYISKAIRVRLERLDKSQKMIAEESDVDASQLSSYMSGRYGWRIDFLDAIAPALGWASGMDIVEAAQKEAVIHRQQVAA